MSAINNSDVHINAVPAALAVSAAPALKAKSVRKPKLPAKTDRLLSFGFWFSQRLFDNGLIPNDLDSKNKTFQTLSMFDSLDAQNALFDSFESQSNANKKAMRLTITAFHKPPKIAKSTKSKSKPYTTNSETKRGRKKNAVIVVVDNHDELISQLVRVANEGSGSGEPRFPRTPPPFTEGGAEGGAELEAEPVTEPVTQVVTSTETVVATKANSKEPKEPKAKVTKTKAVKDVAVEPVAPVVVEQPVVMVEQPVVMVESVAPVVVETQPKKKAAAKKAVKEAVVVPVVEPVVAPAAVESAVAPVVVESQPKKKAAKKAPTSEEKSEAKSEEKPKSKSKAKSSLPVTVPEPSLPTPSIPEPSIPSSSSSEEGGGLGGDLGSPLDVHAREFIFQGKTFLIDSDNNDIYDFDTQDLLGNFDPKLTSIRFI